MEFIEGIVINQKKYKENSKIIYILTKQGMISLLVKASCLYNSKNFKVCSEMTKIKFIHTNSNKNTFNILTQYEILNNYKNIKTTYDKLAYIYNIIVNIYKYNEHVTNFNNLYELLEFTLNGVNEVENNIYYVKLFVCTFYAKLLYLLGIGPKFSKCVCCEKNGTYYSVSHGGMVCESCSKSIKNVIKDNYINLFKAIYLTKLKDFTIEDFNYNIDYTNDIFNLLQNIYDEYLGLKISFRN